MVNSESWQINIEQSTAFIESQVGAETVNATFKKHNATGLEGLCPCYFLEVYNELSVIEANLRN